MATLSGRAVVLNNNNNGVNGNNNLNNNGRSIGIDKLLCWDIFILTMKNAKIHYEGGGDNDLRNLFDELCSKENLELAFKNARKKKTTKHYVIDFEAKLEENLELLRSELLLQSYRPKPLETFILRDPKTRKISKSAFRDRVVHHATFNVIESLFENRFIFDSFANRKGKGSLNAIARFESFTRKASESYSKKCYVLKADIRHYFDTVNHDILQSILSKKISDKRVLRLIKIILKNHKTKEASVGMPLGNLTSQFFANVYLNELDQFVKHTLRAKYYIRYVDDFVIVHSNRAVLEDYKLKIEHFLLDSLKLKLHPDKSKVHNLNQGVGFLGFRLFEQHRRIKKKNVRRFERKLLKLRYKHNVGKIDREKVVEHFEGWLAYITNANTFKYRKHLVRQFNHFFPLEKEIKKEDITKHRNFLQKSTNAELQFSVQKTLQLLNEGKNTSEIAEIRNMGVGTIWKHIVNLIEYNQTSMWKIIGREKAQEILQQISSENETLSDIKAKLFNPRISFDEIECVRAYLKAKNRKKNVQFHVQWYKKLHCMRKCYLNKYQRELCSEKFKIFISGNADLLLKRHDFINLFNDHLTICVLPENEKRMILPWKSVLLMKRYMKEKRKKGVVSSPPF